MAVSFSELPNLRNAGFDTIIDVRSPAEYAQDHVPGAVNMPVLSNEERAHVGTIYTQDSPFTARKIGAALVARNAAAAIETNLMDKTGGWRPLVYCWRGGQRSGSFATILTQIGWRAETLEGGYQSWRRHVVSQLYDAALPFQVIRLDGLTGTAKTDVLRAAAALGAQTLDLEGLANHRGSILGDIDGAQPAQKMFETRIVAALVACDPARPLLVEAESARIGALRVPPALWAAMKGSPRITLTAPSQARAQYLAAQYETLCNTPATLTDRLNALRPLVGHATVAGWLTLLADGDAPALANALIADHYDPAYRRLRHAETGAEIASLSLNALTPSDIDAAARALLSHLA